jgi:hypothetical protein
MGSIRKFFAMSSAIVMPTLLKTGSPQFVNIMTA